MKFEDEIYEVAEGIVPSGTEENLLRMLCRAAERKLRAGLRPEVREEEYADALICASAWLAAASLGGAEAETKSFRVGEVSVTTGTSSREQMRKLAAQIMEPYSQDNFAFLEV